jgi:hypothetical protein
MMVGASHVIVTGFATLTLTAADVVTLPAASRARAASVCTPFDTFVVDQGSVNGAAANSGPSGAPLSRNCTPATPTSSDAVADTVTAGPSTLLSGAGAVIVTVGKVVSVTLLVTVTATLADVIVLPARSRATAVSEWLPLTAVVVSHVMVNGLARSSTPRSVPSTLNCTPTTPTLSLAAAETATAGPDTVAPSTGAVNATAGAVLSAALNGRISAMNRL